MCALISDIHANLEALEAVFAHIDAHIHAKKINCLGDVVGYGPDPTAVIDLVEKRCEWSLMGNHDCAMLHSPAGFNDVAADAIACQRTQLDPGAEEHEPGIFAALRKKHRWKFLQHLPERVQDGGVLFVHASPRSPTAGYIFPRDIVQNPSMLKENFKLVTRRCYVGHTHRPGVFTEEPRFYAPTEVGMEFRFAGHAKLIINVGSVGQPRDGDWRACYATICEDAIRWHRVEYDVQKTIEKVLANPCLDGRCGLRLLRGR